ncbi:MAG TPA: putative phage tail protein [Symbiobacteriaceae bacterium]|jgi:uncharacterized protein YmfQ (DUF2313 family)|nr:putative phage tail protein [Symbiobacteriaceae bacterium]
MADYAQKLEDLLSYAPAYYQESGLYRALMSAEADEIVRYREALEDIFRQFFVETATWGLGYWEAELGLVTNPSLSNQARRAAVLQKLRGTGTLSADKLSAILGAYGPRMAQIDENTGAYHFDAVLVDFIQSANRPMEDQGPAIRDAVANARPAHLTYTVRYQEYIAELFRDWWAARNGGQDFSRSDIGTTAATLSTAEPRFGHEISGLFLLNQSPLGATGRLGPRYWMQDVGVTEWTRGKEAEAYTGLAQTNAAFHLTTATLSGLETAPARTELHRAEQTLQPGELGYLFNELNGFMLGATPLNAGRLFPQRIVEETGGGLTRWTTETYTPDGDAGSSLTTTTRAETAPRAAESNWNEHTLQPDDLGYLFTEPEGFMLGVTPLNQAKLFPQRVVLLHAAAWTRTLAEAVSAYLELGQSLTTVTRSEAMPDAAEWHLTQATRFPGDLGYTVASHKGLRLGRTCLNRHRLAPMRAADEPGACLYRLSGGQEQVVERRTLSDTLATVNLLRERESRMEPGPVAWSAYNYGGASGLTLSLSAADAYDGAAGLVLNGSGGTPGDRGALLGDANCLYVRPNTAYTFAMRVRIPAPIAGGAFYPRVIERATDLSLAADRSGTPLTTTNGWEQVLYSFTTGPATWRLELRLHLSGAGQAAVDEVRLEAKAPDLFEDGFSVEPWSLISGAGLTTEAGQIRLDGAGGTGLALSRRQAAKADQSVTAVVERASGQYPSVLVRADANGTSYYMGRYNYAAGAFELFRADASGVSTLAAVAAPAPGDRVVLTLQAVGNSVKLYCDGAEKVSATDAAALTGRYYGFRSPGGDMYFNWVRLETA